MVRDIKRIVHDLTPMSDVVSELSALISKLLSSMKDEVTFVNPEAAEYFFSCLTATEKLAISAGLISRYIDELRRDAGRE